MSVEQLQRMKYVSEQAGVPVEALEGGIGKLNKNIGMAAAGKSKDLAALEDRNFNAHSNSILQARAISDGQNASVVCPYHAMR